MKKVVLSAVISVMISACSSHQAATQQPTAAELAQSVRAAAVEQQITVQPMPYKIELRGADEQTVRAVYAELPSYLAHRVDLYPTASAGAVTVVSHPTLCFYPARALPIWKLPCAA